MADITILNLNMLYIRHFDVVEKEIHLPLGPLYITRALENKGLDVDFRDYQLNNCNDPFDINNIIDFLKDSADIIGISCMANLLPFSILVIKELEERYPEKRVILGGVSTKSVEEKILENFPWMDIIVRGEGEKTAPELLDKLLSKQDISMVKGINYRKNGKVISTPDRERIMNLDNVSFPAFHHINLKDYQGYGIITSRGCPYSCTFCSVAPIWGFTPYFRSNKNIIEEMKFLNQEAGVNLFLFQDEFFVSGKERVVSFCQDLKKSGLNVKWKTFGRINLTDEETMKRMVDVGCIEIRYGIESGSDRILELTKKGFKAKEAIDVITKAINLFNTVDAFYIWGFPFENMDDFYQSVFQMNSLRMMGVNILPSLLCLLPQTEIFKEWYKKRGLEFCSDLFPEYMVTGHESCKSFKVEISPQYEHIFDFIKQHPDIFPGFFHFDIRNNILPKLEVLSEFGFYPSDNEPLDSTESCGAHSPKVKHSC